MVLFIGFKRGESRLRRIFRNKCGISPILATLLLIVIAVAAIIVTYAWITTYMSGATSHAGVYLQKDAVSWGSGTPKNITIYVRNSGTSDAYIDRVYIGTSENNLVLQDHVVFDPSDGFVGKEGGVVAIYVNYTWASNQWYYFRIVPKVGEPLTFQAKAP